MTFPLDCWMQELWEICFRKYCHLEYVYMKKWGETLMTRIFICMVFKHTFLTKSTIPGQDSECHLFWFPALREIQGHDFNFCSYLLVVYIYILILS